jgi:ribonuclease D
MADPKVEKVLHGADNDIMLLKRDFKWEFESVFDTQVAARFAGRNELGLQAVLETEFGVRLSKSLQRCDWSRRPLSRPQELYAAEDVAHLVKLRDRLLPELQARGRETWAREEGQALGRLAPAPVREPADFLKAKGAFDLDGRSLAVLRELFALRDEWARNADLPLFKVVGDEPLVEIATRKPKDVGGLSKIRGLSAYIKGRRAPDVLAAVRRGEAVAETDLPTRTWTKRPKPVPGYSRRVDRIKAWRVDAAKKAGLEPGVLLPQRLIERIAIDQPGDMASLSAVPDIRRWRAENFGEEILQAAKP